MKKNLPQPADVPVMKVAEFAAWVKLGVSTINQKIAQGKLKGVVRIEGDERDTTRIFPWLAVQSLGLSEDDIRQLGEFAAPVPVSDCAA